MKPLFNPGKVVATRGYMDLFSSSDIAETCSCNLVYRHIHGDFGVLTEDDRNSNFRAINQEVGMIFSAYQVVTVNGPQKVYCITESDRSCTTLLLPEEY